MAGNRNQPNLEGNLGQETMANSLPVVIASDQSAVPVTGEFSITGGATSDNQTNGTQKTQVVDAGGEAVTVTDGKLDVNASIDTTGLATSANQETANTSLGTIAGDTTSIDGKITACNTGAIAGTVTANAGTNLNTSALALETGGNLATIAGDTTSLDGKTPALGTAAMVASTPVTIATNDTMITALDAAVDSIDGKITACDTTALATEAGNLATIAGDTTSIDGKTPALGQALEAASVPVVLPAGQITTLTPPAAITGFAVESGGNLDTIAGDTTSLDGKTPALGTALMAASVPVTIATNDTMITALDAAVDSIDGKITACNTGDVTIGAAIPAGNNNIGDVDVASIAAGNNNIGDVDVASIAAGDNNIGNVDIVTLPAGNLGQQAMAASLSVVPANNVTDATYIGDIKFGEALPAGTNAIGKLSANSGVDIGDVDVASIAAGSNLIGDVGIGVRTSGGATMYKNLDVDESEDEVKDTAGQVYMIHAINLKNAPLYLKFYDADADDVTVGTTVPNWTFPVPSFATTNGAGFVVSMPYGIAFSNAITIACTTGLADNNTGAPGANEMVVNLAYK